MSFDPQSLPRRKAVQSGLVGTCPPMQELRRQIAAVARRACTVLIEGETGVGKEVVAREIHAHSARGNGAFVPVDCTTLGENLFESQLFGHVKGAFTGALGDTLGLFRCAQGGTLFLDEIGELPLHAQAKLLRCIQDRAVRPVGGVRSVPVDVRIVAATHRDLLRRVRDGEFREDLFFRLNVINLSVPPLRDRQDDLLRLAEHLLEECAATYEEPPKKLAPSAQSALLAYDWPGNVRELRNALERAFVFCVDRTIEANCLPPQILSAAAGRRRAAGEAAVPTLADVEREAVARALRVSRGNQTEAARLLNVERHKLHRMILRLGLGPLTQTRCTSATTRRRAPGHPGGLAP